MEEELQLSEQAQKELIYLKCEGILNSIGHTIKLAEALGITNEQKFIEFEMELSYLATQDHNKREI